MRIEILHVPGCPNLATAHARLDDALEVLGVSAVVAEVEVDSPTEATRLGMSGSPTIVADGRDLFDGTEASLACRLYRNAGTVDGAPSVAALVR